MDSVRSVFSRLSLGDTATLPRTTDTKRSITRDTDIFEFDKFIAEALDSGIRIIDPDDIERRKHLGSGSTMSAFEGKWKCKEKAVALKYINFTPSVGASGAGRDPEFHSILRSAALELRVLSHDTTRSHANIVDILALSWQEHILPTGLTQIFPIFVMELACPEHPTLMEKMSSTPDLSVKLSLLWDVLEGLSALHELGVVHGDLKPENVLVFHDDEKKVTAKLSDFAFSHVDKDTSGCVDVYAGGTEYWNAPECLKNALGDLVPFRKERYRDIYSYGLVAVFVLLGELPFAQQGLILTQISSMKVEDKISSLFASRWRFMPSGSALQPAEWRDLTSSDLEVIQQQPLRWQVLQNEKWCVEEDLPLSLLRLIPKMLHLQPLERPVLDDIRTALKSCTGDRAIETQPPTDDGNKSSNEYRVQLSVTGTRKVRAKNICDPEIPPALRVALFRNVSAAARGPKSAKRTNAMLNMGYLKLRGFGTFSDTQEAMFWFGRAAMDGNKTAQEMVFRFEKLVNKSATELILGLDRRLRVNWMVTCLLPDVGSSRLRDKVPEQIRLDSPLERLEIILLRLEPEMVEKGLRRAVDDSVVRIPAMQKRDYSQDSAWTTLPDLWTAITRDDASLLQRVIKPNDPRWSENLKQTVIFAIVEERSANILRSLVYDYKFDMDEIFQYGMGRSFLKSDTEMVAFFLGLGCPFRAILSSTAINMIITGCTVPAIEMALGFYDLIRVSSGVDECPSYWSMDLIRRQLIDGIQPLMCYSNLHEKPIDNEPPPIFEATGYNRPINLSLILSAGGNPNVRYMGTTALHLAVRLLRPLLVGLLLAFGADPNARDFKSSCETPLHQLSSAVFHPLHADDKYYSYWDMFGDPFISASEDPDEHDHHRKLIIQLLLEYGADIDAVCGNQLTPVSKAVLSTAPHASVVVKCLAEAGADPSKAGIAGMSALHAASGRGRLQDLRQLLLLASLPALEQKLNDSLTPLMVTCIFEGRDRFAVELLDAGANITTRNCAGLNALSMAMRHGRKGIFNLFIDRVKLFSTSLRDQILVDNSTGSGHTAAHGALDVEDQTMAPYFLQELAPLMSKLHKPTKAGMTPLHLAVCKKNMPALKVIMANTPDVNARAHGGVTPLHLAYGLQEPVLIDYLISWNADPELRNDDHLTPYAFGSTCRRDPNTLSKYLATISAIESAGLRKEAFGPVNDYNVLASELLERSQYVPRDRFTRDASDPSQGITKVEEVHLVMFESSLAKNGERHYDTLWRMNNLGCVYERYGRLTRAEGIYRKGWNIAKDVLGNGHILAADFANKLRRVQEDIGRALNDDGLSAWMAVFKKDTLNRPLVEYRSSTDEEVLKCLFPPTQEAVEGVCDRVYCEKSAAIICPVCLVFRYCSESCKTADWTGDKAFHGRECMRSLSVAENLAIISRALCSTDQYARNLTNYIFSKLTAMFINSDFGNRLPTVSSAHLILYNPRIFQQPLRLRTKSNTVVLFLSNGGFKYMIKATDSQWKAPKGFEMVLLYHQIDLWVAPDPSTSKQVSDNTPSVVAMYAAEEYDQMLLMVEYIHLDFPKAMARRAQRLAAEESKSHQKG